jgi:acetyl-CoA synthetase
MSDQTAIRAITDGVPADSLGAREIGFSVPERYNASEILFRNLTEGRGDRLAVAGPAGQRTYAELCTDSARFGNALLSLGLRRGDRVLMFLDDTPAYPAAFFGAVRAGFVPLLINLLTPPDLLQFYLADSCATVAVAEGAFSDRFDAVACKDTRLKTLIVVNGASAGGIAVETVAAAPWLAAASPRLEVADTHRNEMCFWMYSSGSTGRPKGIVHLQHDMAYTNVSYSRNILKLTPHDLCFSVPKIFFAYGFGNSITFPFSVGAASLMLPGQPKPAAIFDAIARFRPTVFFGLPTLYTALTKAPEATTADLSSIRLAVSAAEILSAEVFNAWKALIMSESGQKATSRHVRAMSALSPIADISRFTRSSRQRGEGLRQSAPTRPWAGVRGGRSGSDAPRAESAPAAPSTGTCSLLRSALASRSPSQLHKDALGCRRAGSAPASGSCGRNRASP